MTATLAQACLDGNLDLVSQILETSTKDIDVQDQSGFTPLQHAVKGNHVEIAARLLAKGASAVQVADENLAKDNPELSQLITNTLKHTQSAVFQAAPVIDSHGGKQMPDGSVSYVQPPVAQQSAEYGTQQQQQHGYNFQPQNNTFDPTQSDQQQQSNAAKDPAAGSLPPPEVARLIPCRFFPNCRYGDKCLFAHPMPLSNASPSQGPVSPGQTPLYYQAPTYGYPAYGPPQHFYSMAPPMPIQYSHSGVPMPIHMPPPPQHMATSDSSPDAYASPFAAQSQPHYMPNGTHYDPSSDASPALDAPSAPVNTNESEPQGETAGDETEATQKETSPSQQQHQSNHQQQQQNQQSHYQQQQQLQPTSFSAFMTHHAVPFQPGQLPFSGAPMGMDGAILSSSQAFPRSNKGPRRAAPSLGGPGNRNDSNGSNGKRSTERPACLFFARSACKHGEECRFPHILPDGTDARGPNAGRSSSIEASRGINRALAAKNARNSGNANGNGHHEQSQNVIPSTSQASAHTTITSVGEPDSVLTQTSTPAVTTTGDSPEKEGEFVSNSAPEASATSDSDAVNGNAKVESNDSAAASRTPVREEAKTGASAAPSSERTPAPIPSKPILNGQPPAHANGKSHTGNKAQANSVAKGQAQNGARGAANGRPNSANTNRPNGHANGFQLPRKINSQRLPHPDDFPALSNGGASAVPVANGAPPKVNFSAILSAPAPPKKQVDTKENADKSLEDKSNGDASAASAADGEAKTAPAPAPVPDFASIVSKPVAV